jgi:hypothetical protein
MPCAVLNEWGLKILVCLTVVLGIVYQNARMRRLSL